MDRIQPEIHETQELTQGESAFSQSELNVAALKSYFSIDNPTSSEVEKLNKVYELVSGEEVHDMTSVLLFLRDTENKLGMAPLGTSRLSHLLQYLTVQAQIQKMSQYKQALEQ